jgi:putative tricarboxylic transport membrane protein
LKSTDPMGPRAFPVLLGIALAIGAILLLVETIRSKRQADEQEKKPQGETEEHPRVLWAVIAWTIVFLLIFEPLGYIVSTTLYILPLMVCFNPKKWWANGVTSVLFPIGVYILFVKFLGVMLPKGVIPW